MKLLALARRFVPTSLKRRIRAWIEEIAREQSAPRMVYGYQTADGDLRRKTRMSNTVYINNPGQAKIGDNVFVGHFTILDATKRLEIGDGSQIGHMVAIFTHSSHNAIRLYGRHYLEVPEWEKLAYQAAEVKIGRYVFIGAKSLILPGVEIGDGAIISAGAVVSKNISPFSIVTRDGKIIADGAKRLDAMSLNSIKNQQLREWYEEWQDGSSD